MKENSNIKNNEYYDRCIIDNSHSELQNTLSNIQNRSHVLIVYNTLSGLREIYASFAAHALNNNEVVVILYHYDNPNNIAYYLKDRGIDVDSYEKERSLLILDSHEPRFFRYKDDAIDFVKLLFVKSKEKGKRGVTVIADMGSFFYKGDGQQSKELLFAFENFIPKQFTNNITRVCLYHKDTLNRVNDDEKDLLYKSHLQCFIFYEQEMSNEKD